MILLPVCNMYLFVKGGLLLRGITEIVGESAAGKTQLCLQLCLSVQLPVKHGGLNGGELSISQWLQRLVIMFISVFHRYNVHIFIHTCRRAHTHTHTHTHHTVPNRLACIACTHWFTRLTIWIQSHISVITLVHIPNRYFSLTFRCTVHQYRGCVSQQTTKSDGTALLKATHVCPRAPFYRLHTARARGRFCKCISLFTCVAHCLIPLLVTYVILLCLFRASSLSSFLSFFFIIYLFVCWLFWY